MQSIVINLARRLRTLHKGNRRKRAGEYLRREVARFAKLDQSKVKISGELNKLLIRGRLSELRRIEVNLEARDGKTIVSLKKPEQKTDQSKQAQPSAAQSQSQPKPASSQAQQSSSHAEDNEKAGQKSGKKDSKGKDAANKSAVGVSVSAKPAHEAGKETKASQAGGAKV